MNNNMLDLYLNGKLNEMAREHPEVNIVALVDGAINNPEFGNSGHYGFFCKHCNGSWSFSTKGEAAVWRKLHKLLGCNMEYVFMPSHNANPETKQNLQMVIRRSARNIHESITGIEIKGKQDDQSKLLTTESPVPEEPETTADNV